LCHEVAPFIRTKLTEHAPTRALASDLKMSESSVSSTISEESGRDHDRAKVTSRLRSLLCCFKRELCATEVAEIGDPDSYDYIVEKLLVKRVPFGLFAIPADPQRMPSTSSHSMSLSTISDNYTRITSKDTTDRSVYDLAASKTVHFGEDEDRVKVARR